MSKNTFRQRVGYVSPDTGFVYCENHAPEDGEAIYEGGDDSGLCIICKEPVNQ